MVFVPRKNGDYEEDIRTGHKYSAAQPRSTFTI